jgi:hypothetical protein
MFSLKSMTKLEDLTVHFKAVIFQHHQKKEILLQSLQNTVYKESV